MPKSGSQLKAAVNLCVSKSNTQSFDCREYGNDLHTPIGEWDVSEVTDMTDLFRGIKSFNADISKWDVSSVTSMQSLFYNAHSFNVDISKWDVSSVRNMQHMFFNAQSFNADISKWNVSSVKNMEYIFNGATSFSRTLCDSAWIVSPAPKRVSMFTGSSTQICFGSQPHGHSPTHSPKHSLTR